MQSPISRDSDSNSEWGPGIYILNKFPGDSGSDEKPGSVVLAVVSVGGPNRWWGTELPEAYLGCAPLVFQRMGCQNDISRPGFVLQSPDGLEALWMGNFPLRDEPCTPASRFTCTKSPKCTTHTSSSRSHNPTQLPPGH